MDRQELTQRLFDIDQRIRSWGRKDWVDLFNQLANNLAQKGAPLEDKQGLRQQLLQNLLGKGSQASDSEMSLAKLLEENVSGLSRSQIFLDLLTEKVNGLIQLEQQSVKKEAATYDSKETDEIMTKQLAERDDYGDAPRGHPSQSYNDYPENSSDVEPWTRPQHQQELWNRLREWWTNLVKKHKNQGEGYWDYKTTPYVAPAQSPGFFLAMPAMKIGQLDSAGRVPTQKVEVLSQEEGRHISATFEFTPSGIRVDCTWDEKDMPPGLSEAEALSRVVKYLEGRLPETLMKLQHAKAEDIDLQNRAITMLIQPEN